MPSTLRASAARVIPARRPRSPIGARSLIVLLLGACAAVLPAGPALAQLTSGVDDTARMAEAVNAIRQQNGRTPLRLQAQLSLAAQRHAESMVQTRTLSHTGANGSRVQDRMRAVGYDTCGGGENIAFGALQNVDDVARGWFDSPSHRAIMLDADVREMGIGRALTPDGLTYWALNVGQRPPIAPILINSEAGATPAGAVSIYVYGQVADTCRGAARQIAQVTLANNADFSDAQTLPYAPTLSWTLAAGEGPRTVYARLRDTMGRIIEAQDEILVSSTAPPPNTASNVSPPVQTYTVQGANGTPTQLTVYRQNQIVPPNAAVTSTPCSGSLSGCWNVGGVGNLGSLPVQDAWGGGAGFPTYGGYQNYGSYPGYSAASYGYQPYSYGAYGYPTPGYQPYGYSSYGYPPYASAGGYAGYWPGYGGTNYGGLGYGATGYGGVGAGWPYQPWPGYGSPSSY